MSGLLFLSLRLLAGSTSQRSGRKFLGEGKIVGFMCMLYEFMLIGVYVCVKGGGGEGGGLGFFFLVLCDGGLDRVRDIVRKEARRERDR